VNVAGTVEFKLNLNRKDVIASHVQIINCERNMSDWLGTGEPDDGISRVGLVVTPSSWRARRSGLQRRRASRFHINSWKRG
jgi:hypothetical protein